MKALIVISIIIAVFALILFIPVRLSILYNSNEGFKYSVSIGFIRFGKKRKSEKKTDTSTEEKRKPKLDSSKLKFFEQYKKEIKQHLTAVLKRIVSGRLCINKLYINAELGFEDAMDTGLVFGAVSGIVYNTAGLMDRTGRLKKHDITLKPDFDTPHIFAEIEAIISTNILNMISIAVTVIVHTLPLYKKLKTMIGEKNNGKSD